MTLSICLITRDAEAHIARAVRSVASLKAEVIVADTGSKDSTVEAARALGAKASSIGWHDDFGAAQNQALAQATGDWVLWLNPDEELLPQGQEHMAALLARAEALAYVVPVQEVMQADKPDGASETLQPRLFRRHPELRYVGRLHPHFDPPLEALALREKMEIYRADLAVRHHAYASELTPDKLRWATRLLELELKDRPGQLHYLIEYGRNLLLLNDPKGHEVMAQAAELVLGFMEAPRAPTPTVALLLDYLLTVSTEQSRSRLLPPEARRLALLWFPSSPPLLWVLAQRAFQAEDFQEAVRLLETVVCLGRTGTYDPSTAFDPSIMAEAAVLNLAHGYLRLGDLDRAEACFRQVQGSSAHQAKAQQGLAMVANLRRRPPKG